MSDISKATIGGQKELANTQGDLFERVAFILEESRANAVHSINSQMLII